MNAFLESLTRVEQIYAGCAVFGAALFLLRTVLLVAGHGEAGADGDAGDVHEDADASFKVLSLQGLTAFFMMFGLASLALSRQGGWGPVWPVVGGLAAGLFTVWVIARIFTGMKKLQSDGTLRLEQAVGQEGEVYLPVAPGKSGQVRVTVQGQLRVLSAATDGAVLETGTRIRVVRVTGGNLLWVEPVRNEPRGDAS